MASNKENFKVRVFLLPWTIVSENGRRARELFAREGVASQQLAWKIKQALTKSNFLRPGILVDAERRHAYC